MGYNFISFPSPSLFPLRGSPHGDDPKDRKPGPNMRAFLIFIMFIGIAIVTMLIAEQIRQHLIKDYERHERIRKENTYRR